MNAKKALAIAFAGFTCAIVSGGVKMDITTMKSKFSGEDPRVPGFTEQHFKTPLRVMVIGAHPDDADVRCSGFARTLVEAGHRVRFVSLVNGDKGHQFMESKDVAVRRHGETRNVIKTLGIEDYIVGDTPDCELQPTLEERKKVTKIIREFGPNIIITHRPNDYHCDHRACATLVQDATYLVGVPLWCPDVPVPDTIPTVFFMGDRFTQPTPFRPDFVIDVSKHEETICRTFACHESQMFEWLVPEHGFKLSDVPPAEDVAGRLAFIRKSALHLVADYAHAFDTAVEKAYPGRKPKLVEVYEKSEYGRPPVKAERDLLASLGGVWIDSTDSKWTQVK